jgi:signal transduction histidine kinase/CheY-like chemotaxis protein
MNDSLKYHLKADNISYPLIKFHSGNKVSVSCKDYYSDLFEAFESLEYPVCVTNEQNEVLFKSCKFSEIFDDDIVKYISSLIKKYLKDIRSNNLQSQNNYVGEPFYRTQIEVRTKDSSRTIYDLSCYIYEKIPNNIWISVLQNNVDDNISEVIRGKINKSKEKFSQALSIDEYCKNSLSRLKDIIHHNIGFIHYYDSMQDEFTLVAHDGVLPEIVVPIENIGNQDSDYHLLKSRYSEEQFIFTNNVSEYPIGEYFLEQNKETVYNTLFIIPLVFRDDLQGMLTVLTTEKIPHDHQVIKAVKGFCKDISFGIHERTLLNNLIEQNHIYRQKSISINEEYRIKSNYVQDICGDISKKIMTISGSSSILSSEYYEPRQVEGKILIKDISDNSQNLLDLVNDIQNITELEPDTTGYKYDSVTVQSLVNEVIENVEPILETKNITITLTYLLEEEYVATDVEKLKQIIKNLLSDATKYCRNSSTMTLQLRNNREGFTCEIISKLKESLDGKEINWQNQLMNYESCKSMLKNINGLSNAKKIAEYIGGEISIETEGQDIMHYEFHLPRMEYKNNHKDNGASLSLEQCIIIGDNPYSNRWLEYYFGRKGFSVSVVNGIMDLQRIKDQSTLKIVILNITHDSAILLDYLKISRSGLNIMDCPVIVVSKPDNRFNAFQLGAVDYFPKPIDLDFLIHRISKLISKQHA